MDFKIKINDGSEVLSDIALEENSKAVSLYDWQQRAIKYFFKNNGQAIFEVTTGCLIGDTLIDMPRNLDKYPKGIPIKNLVGKNDFYTYTINLETYKLELKKVKNVWLSKTNVDVYKIKTLSGKEIIATDNHPFLVDIKKKPLNGSGRGAREKIVNREFRQLKDLKIGDYLCTFNRPRIRSSDGELIKYDLSPNNKNRRILEHRFILSQIKRKLTNYEIGHHIDENRFNNSPNNLIIMDSKEHNSMHTKKRGLFGKAIWPNGQHPKGYLGKKHSAETKKIISLNTSLAKNNKTYISPFKGSKSFLKDGFNSLKYKTNKESSINKFKETIKNIPKEILSDKSSKNRKVQYSDKIVSIEYVGKDNVYDMEVEDNHNFIANGFFVHNSGKTFCSIQLIKEIWKEDPDARVLIVVPKNIILEDTWFRELYDNGISLKDIGVFYGAIKDLSKVTITNMQSLDKVPLESFDMQIYDECHNYGTTRLLPLIANQCKYKVGLSATLERMDNNHYKILEIFNYNVFRYTPKEALDDGVLNPFVFTNIGVEMDHESYKRYDTLTQELNSIINAGGGFNQLMRSASPLKFKMLGIMSKRKDLVNNYLRKFDVVKLICEGHREDKIIVFNEFNKSTSSSYWHLLDIGVQACTVHSGIGKKERDQYMTDFRNDKYQVILASKVLDEGYNLPKIDTAIIAAGNSTSKQTIQRMGRVLRKKKKHSNLYQIYVKATIEEEYAAERAKMFKDLCSNYNEYTYTLKGELV